MVNRASSVEIKSVEGAQEIVWEKYIPKIMLDTD